ncbi:MAG: AmmeMemoRadiSam system protein A [Syntrophomonadaceae bacterium]|jgi:AmmeMemoRadiSam system protein A
MITYAALSPHPPLLIPEIGGDQMKEVVASEKGMQQMARQLIESCPETIVFITPHGNVFADAISILADSKLEGDFANFGNPQIKASYDNDFALLNEIARKSSLADIDVILLDKDTALNNRLNPRLDHGIMVPLHYLKEAGLGEVNIVAISIAFLPILELYSFGTLIRDAAKALGRRVAIIASGDMSHRLKNEGPYNYHPDGERFDYEVKNRLGQGDVRGFLNIPEKIRENAGECGYRSLVIMFGALDSKQFNTQIFSYEGPFGVGYLTAGFLPIQDAKSLLQELREKCRQDIKQKRSNESMPVRWARMVMEEYIRNKNILNLPPEMEELERKKAGVFVSLKKNGQLRGCIGTITAVYSNLAQEIAHNAISAGTADPRFLPISQTELEDIVYSVDVLGEAQPCSQEDLDPKRYGVIVSKGKRRGLLLPDLEGVDTVEEQLFIALKKAGISPSENYKIERFEVIRFN